MSLRDVLPGRGAALEFGVGVAGVTDLGERAVTAASITSAVEEGLRASHDATVVRVTLELHEVLLSEVEGLTIGSVFHAKS